MPTRGKLDAFIDLVVTEKHVEAIEQFYHEEASMQENFNPPRAGRGNLIAFEKKSHEAFQSMESFPPHIVIHDGDNVAIQWQFDIIDPTGQRRRLKELAVQIWQGDRIMTEQFFYDSAQAWQPVE